MRIYSLDLVKIIAIFMIICSHVSLYFVIRTPEDFGVLFLRQFGQFGVVMFYMASGYFLLNNRHDDQFSYACNKAKNVAIALVFWLCFYYLYDRFVISSLLNAPQYDFWEFFDTSRNLSEATHLWFLFSIIGLYFILPLLRFAFVQQNRQLILKVTFTLFLIANLTTLEKVLNSVFHVPSPIHFSLLQSSQIYGLVSFLLGGYFGLIYQPTELTFRRYLVLSVVALVSFSLLTIQTQYWGITFFYGKYYTVLLQISAVSVFYLMLHTPFSALEGFITKVGSKTLGIYLVHNIFVLEINGSPLYDILYGKFGFLTPYGYILLYALITFILSYYLCCLLSKNRWLNKVISM